MTIMISSPTFSPVYSSIQTRSSCDYKPVDGLFVIPSTSTGTCIDSEQHYHQEQQQQQQQQPQHCHHKRRQYSSSLFLSSLFLNRLVRLPPFLLSIFAPIRNHARNKGKSCYYYEPEDIDLIHHPIVSEQRTPNCINNNNTNNNNRHRNHYSNNNSTMIQKENSFSKKDHDELSQTSHHPCNRDACIRDEQQRQQQHDLFTAQSRQEPMHQDPYSDDWLRIEMFDDCSVRSNCNNKSHHHRRRSRRVHFAEGSSMTDIQFVPHRTDYSTHQRQAVWMSHYELKGTVAKNRKEYLYEQLYYGGYVLEERYFCYYDGSIIHPVHLPLHLWNANDMHIRWQQIRMDEQEQ